VIWCVLFYLSGVCRGRKVASMGSRKCAAPPSFLDLFYIYYRRFLIYFIYITVVS
jgi:hypothetical protein